MLLVLMSIALMAGSPAPASGVPQCLRAEGARFLNVPADHRTARRGVRAYPLVLIVHVDGTTVFVWERTRRRIVHRIYLLWPGRHGKHARRAASRRVRKGEASVLLSDSSRAAARHLDRVCIDGRG